MTEHRLGREDAGRTVPVAAGDRLVVALPERAGTGYTWEVESLPDGARVLEERYEQAGAAIGGESLHVFVVEPGSGGLRLRHRRPWEGDTEVLERFEVTARPAPDR